MMLPVYYSLDFCFSVLHIHEIHMWKSVLKVQATHNLGYKIQNTCIYMHDGYLML